ncbi:MAG: ATP-binding protein [Lachnospiraceae bacterium]|nr:ATP-binding protein [Lachnospiraceae bacterium]MCI9545650.1 ATP-binding protein [Lachnospiraceae bacterium]
MMPEISLNVLDVAENSIRAEASLVEILVTIDLEENMLKIQIIDDGKGMTEEQMAKVTDPFFTTRTTRKVGLGIPFFKLAAEATGGSFQIESEVGKGTKVTTIFKLDHIDRMPLGDINSTIHTLVVYNPQTDFLYRYTYGQESFELDTRQMKEILGGVPLDAPEVSAYIKEYLDENKSETDGGAIV